MFIELVSGVKYPKIITVGFILNDHLWMFCRRGSCFTLVFILFFVTILYIILGLEFVCLYFGTHFVSSPPLPATCELASRVDLESSLSRVLLSP